MDDILISNKSGKRFCTRAPTFDPSNSSLSKESGGNQVVKREGCFFYTPFLSIQKPMAGQKEIVRVFATSKLDSIQVYQDVHGVPVANSNPEELSGEKEPLTDDSMEQATWKAKQIADRFPILPHQLLSIIAADTSFSILGKVRHKPGNEDGRQTADQLASISQEPYLLEAQDWFKGPFTATWQNAIVYHVLGRLNRIARVQVTADYPVGIDPEQVREHYNPKLNSRYPLIEQAESMAAKLKVSNGPGMPEHDISYALATQIIRERVLPKHWMDEMRKHGHPVVVKDAQGMNRRLVYLSLQESLERT